MLLGRKLLARWLVAVAIVACLGLVACGDDSEDAGSGATAGPTTTAATTPSTTGSTTAATTPAADEEVNVEEAKRRLAEVQGPPEFKPNGDPLDGEKVKALQGKTIWFISQTQAVPYFVNVYNGIKEAAEAVGMKTRVFDAQGKPAAYNQGVAAAIAQGAAGIILGFPPDQMQPALGERAKKAGIPIADAGVTDLTDPLAAGVVGHVGWSYRDAGKRQADWVVADSGGNAKVLVLLSVGYKVQDYRVEGFKEELEELCKTCSVAAVHHVPFVEWTKQLPTLTTTSITKDPDINYILVGSDAIALNVVKGVHQMRNTEVKLVGSDASQYNLGLIKDKDVQAADIGVSQAWVGWGTVDVLLQALAGGKPDNVSVPLRMFTRDDVPEKIDDENELFPGDWRGGFKKSWGLG